MASEAMAPDQPYELEASKAGKAEHVNVSTMYPGATEAGQHTQLRRGLQARHITMIAIGGAIGTGLIIGTYVGKDQSTVPDPGRTDPLKRKPFRGAALARAGPASVLISYSAVGCLVFLVMAALGEMAAWLPLPSGFTGYAARFCDPALGFSLGYTSVPSFFFSSLPMFNSPLGGAFQADLATGEGILQSMVSAPSAKSLTELATVAY